MITTLGDRVAALPADLRAACARLFAIDITSGAADPPPTMRAWVERHFGSVEAVRRQTIVRVVNRLTLEAALFNPLRARRPLPAGGGDAELEARIAAALAAGDVFADPLRDTTADLFGRVRGRHCVTASNVAKYDGWHGLVIFQQPHPLRFGQAELRDYLATALRWIAAAHAQDAQAIYPLIFWNCLPKSGATQMHGHMQIALGGGMHYARVELWRRAAQSYGPGYFADLFALHQALGLALPLADVQGFAHLTPLRNREIVLLAAPSAAEASAPAPADRAMPALMRLADALALTLRGLIEGQGVRSFNLALALPPLVATAEAWGDFPLLARLADRGDPLSSSSDLGAVELYASACITADPFLVVAQLADSLR